MRPTIVLAGGSALPIAAGPSLLSLYTPEFLAARTGSDAFALMAARRPRLSIIAHDLGDMTGIDLAKLVRADRELRHMSLILLGIGAPGGASRLVNGYFDVSAGTDVERVTERAERLLCISPRVTTRAPVCLGRRLVHDTTGSFAQTVNLSESGMLLDCQHNLTLGEDVSLRFVLPTGTELIRADGRVVRDAGPPATLRAAMPPATRSRRSFGLEFTQLMPEDQIRIRRFVDRSIQPS